MDIRKRESRFASVGYLLDSGYLWLARDLNGSIAAYSHKPFKLDDESWRVEAGESKEMFMWVDDGELYNFVKWEDDEPVNIREWLEKEEEEMQMYSVKDGELVSEEVDATNGIVALGVNDVVVPDGATTIKVNSRNSGKSAILDKTTTLGGLLAPNEVDMASCGDLTVEPLIRFPYLTSNMMATEGQDMDVRSMYPEQLTMDTSLINKIVSGIDVNRDIDYRPISNIQIHGKICQELTETYKKKNADYGNSFENSLDKHGLIAGIVRMDDKMSRLISLNSKNKQLVLDESLRDTLMDLANYAIMSVMWLDEQ